MKHLMVIIIALFLSQISASKNAGQSIEFLYEQYPPLNFDENGVVKGTTIEILEMILNDLEIPIPEYQAVPWTRGFHLVQTDSPIVLMTMARTQTREELVQWVGPLFTTRHLLISYEKSEVNEYDVFSRQDILIGAMKKDISETVLLEADYPTQKIDTVYTASKLLTMLQPGRFEVISISEKIYDNLLATDEFNKSDYKIVGVVKSTQGYIALSHGVDKAFVELMQVSLKKQKEKHKSILDAYGFKL